MRAEEPFDKKWQVPANSLLIPVVGEAVVSKKLYQIGDVAWPAVYDSQTPRVARVVPEQNTVLLELPFKDYVLIN